MREWATGFGLIEAPLWDGERGLYFSDVPNGGVSLLDRAGKVSCVIPKRRGIGGMARHADGGLIIGGRDISYVDGEKSTPLFKLDAIPGATGFNDLTTDRAGRIYVGSLAFRVFSDDEAKPGHLHVIDLDGAMRTVADGVMLTNGLGFSPDGATLYHSDTRSELVRAYDVKSDGALGAWRPFTTGDRFAPDGLAVASDGSVWVADARNGRVVVFAPDGTRRADVPVPLPMVTSVCFGGEGLRELFIVTGSQGGPRENCGTVFSMPVDVAGLARPLARVKH
jgi:gluconolactonase